MKNSFKNANRSLAIILAIAVVFALLSGLVLSNTKAKAASSFETNMTGWTAVDGSTWSVTERGFETDRDSSITDEPFKFLAKSDVVVDGKKSFKYEISYVVVHGYGAGVSLVTESRTNFYAIEVNVTGQVYYPSVVNGTWSTYAPYGTDLSQTEISSYDNVEHTLIFEYNAEDGTGKVTLDGVVRSEASIPSKALKGNLGLYFEDAEMYFTKAIFTQTGEDVEKDLKKYTETNMELSGTGGDEWEYTKNGYICSVAPGKHVATSDIIVDGNSSFKYEVTFSYTGYGAGLAFNAESPQNVAAIEINVVGEVYFPLLTDGAWSTFYANGIGLTDEEKANSTHTITFIYDAFFMYAEVYVDGELKQEMFDINPDIISGPLGLYYEDATCVYSKVMYTELETRTPAPEETEIPTTDAPSTDVPTTDAPATDAPATEVPATAEPKNVDEDGNNSIIWIIVGIASAAIVVGVVILILQRRKNNRHY